MKRFLITICLSLAAFNCNSDGLTPDGVDEQIAAAKDAVKTLAGTLKTELQAAMQSGGPTAAIRVCNTRAMPLTHEIANEKNLHLARVSSRNRNPANAPNAWQAAVLQDFEERQAQGKDINKLAWSETVEVDGAQEFRFMKAIPTGGVCLACHGTQISPELSQVLAERYPGDKATGFSEGDIRGAFVVTRKLSD